MDSGSIGPSLETLERVASLRGLGFTNSAGEQDFDDIVSFAARVCDAPVGLISLLERDRQWFKAVHGLELRQTPIDQAICVHAVGEESLLEIADTHKDPRTRDNPLCNGVEAFRFYAGAVLRFDSGVPIGTLCVLDRRPRRLNAHQRETLKLLARQVVRQIELREALAVQARLRGEIDHRVKNSLQMVGSYLRLQRRSATSEAREVLLQAERQVAAIVELHAALNNAGAARILELETYLTRIADLVRQSLPPNLGIEVELASATCRAEQAAAIGLIVNEFVANSVKHAFPDDEDGMIRLSGAVADGTYVLRLEDDGVGVSDAEPGGFGLSIIDAAARQLDALVERSPVERGTALVLTFPADVPSPLSDLPTQ